MIYNSVTIPGHDYTIALRDILPSAIGSAAKTSAQIGIECGRALQTVSRLLGRLHVAGEVLPSIRKTGGYSVQPKPEPVKLLPANPDVLSTFFGALRAYVGASSAKAPLWIGVSEHVFSELGITDLNGLNDDNIGQAIRAIIADVNGANIGAMRSDYYRIG